MIVDQFNPYANLQEFRHLIGGEELPWSIELIILYDFSTDEAVQKVKSCEGQSIAATNVFLNLLCSSENELWLTTFIDVLNRQGT